MIGPLFIPHCHHHHYSCLCPICVQQQISDLTQQIKKLEERKRYLTGLLFPYQPAVTIPSPFTPTLTSKEITCSDIVGLVKKQD